MKVRRSSSPMVKPKITNGVPPPSDKLHQIVANIAQDFGGSEANYLHSKKVNHSDVDRNQHRLQLPACLMAKFKVVLKPEDMAMVKTVQGLPVTLVDGDRRVVENMRLKYYTTNKSFRITGSNYSRFVRDYGLKEEAHALHVWVFHVGREFGIALIKQELVQLQPADVPRLEMLLGAGWKVKDKRTPVKYSY